MCVCEPTVISDSQMELLALTCRTAANVFCDINNSKLPPNQVLTLSPFSVFVCHCGLESPSQHQSSSPLRVSVIKDHSENS